MKKILYTTAIAAIALISTAKAQVSIGVNIGTPAPVMVAPGPVWVPAGAPSPYYYFPDINCYYDMGVGQYIYFENNRWLYSRGIPRRYEGYNFRGGRIMPMSRNVFVGRGIPGYRGGGRQVIVNNNYVMRGNNGNHYGQYKNWKGGRGGREDGNWQGGGGRWNGGGHEGRGNGHGGGEGNGHGRWNR